MDGPLNLYYESIEEGHWRGGDAAQENLVRILDFYAKRLNQPSGFWSRLWGKKSLPDTPHGLYVCGPVGRGKTALVDLFFRSLTFAQKKRIHFYVFMQEIHNQLFVLRQQHTSTHQELVAHVARTFAQDLRVLCFDEFQVDNIVDASILSTILETFFHMNLFVVMTSNIAPSDLYAGGLNRSRFMPCIALIQTSMQVVEVLSPYDYRLVQERHVDHYFSGPQAKTQMDDLFQRMTGVSKGQERSLIVKGRTVLLKNVHSGIVRRSFEDLCGQALGSGDYLALMPMCHMLMVDDVPIFTDTMRDKMMRFIMLIDVVYDAGILLAVSACAEPQALSSDPIFARTASRLMELRGRG